MRRVPSEKTKVKMLKLSFQSLDQSVIEIVMVSMNYLDPHLYSITDDELQVTEGLLTESAASEDWLKHCGRTSKRLLLIQ